MDNEIISFSGFGFRSIDSTMFRIGLNVFLANVEHLTVQPEEDLPFGGNILLSTKINPIDDCGRANAWLEHLQ